MLRVVLSVFMSLCLLMTSLPPAQAESEQMTIYLPCFTYGNGQEEFCERASLLMQDAGFDVRFEVFKPASRNYAKDYTEFMIDHSADGNCAFVAPTSVLEPLLDEGWFEEILPTDRAAQPANHMAVLIKTDLLEEYGQAIRDASSLEDWLYQRMEETGATPLAASPFLYDRMYGGYVWLNLFLPEEGYHALNHEFSDPYSTDFFAALEEEAFYSLHDLPALSNCADRYLDWMENKLVAHYTLKRAVDLSGYDAVLVNTEDFLAPLMLANNSPLASLDFSEYSLQILYADQLPLPDCEATPSTQYGVCASEGTQDQLNDFMDWISSAEGYRLLHYGEEYVDYVMEDGVLVPDESSDYALWEQRALFMRDELEPELREDNMPVNFKEEMELLQKAPASRYSKEAFEELSQELNEAGYAEALSKLSSQSHSFCENIYTSAFAPSVRDLAHLWLDNLRKMDTEYAICTELLYQYLMH